MRQKTSSLIWMAGLMLSITLLVGGCGSTRQAGFEEAQNVPDWVSNPQTTEDVYYGIGIAQKANPALAQQAADSRARDAIVRAVEVEISNIIRDSMGEVLTTFGPEGRDYTESVSEQIGSMTLRGAIIEKREVHGKTWYSLARINIAEMRTNILEAAQNTARRNEAMYQRFQAEQSFDRLHQGIDRMKGATNTVNE